MPSKLKLVDGEEVSVSLESVCNQHQTFLRVGPNLVAGVVNMDPPEKWHGIYLWHNLGGVYYYVGDIVLRECEEQTAVEVCANAHIPLQDVLEEQETKAGFSAEARRCLQESVRGLSQGAVPNHVRMLARAKEAAFLACSSNERNRQS